MKTFIMLCGRSLFWILRPVWSIYFKLAPKRSRIFVISGDKLLLLRPWLSNGSWGLPGGGVKRGESIEASACRELFEEVGICAELKDLQPLGAYTHETNGLKFDAHFFLLILDEVSRLKLRRYEIADARWVPFSELDNIMLSEDTHHGLNMFMSRLRSDSRKS